MNANLKTAVIAAIVVLIFANVEALKGGKLLS